MFTRFAAMIAFDNRKRPARNLCWIIIGILKLFEGLSMILSLGFYYPGLHVWWIGNQIRNGVIPALNKEEEQ